jgi:hypothetical protein
LELLSTSTRTLNPKKRAKKEKRSEENTMLELVTKRKRALILLASFITILAIFTSSVTTTAKEPTSDVIASAEIHFRGTLDNWYLVNGTYDKNAKILSSTWLMGFTPGGIAGFYAKYLELNVYEEIPGTYDDFVIFMLASYWEPYNDGYYLEGRTYWWKNGVLTYEWDAEIIIDLGYYETQLMIDFIRTSPNFLQIQGSLKPDL